MSDDFRQISDSVPYSLPPSNPARPDKEIPIEWTYFRLRTCRVRLLLAMLALLSCNLNSSPPLQIAVLRDARFLESRPTATWFVADAGSRDVLRRRRQRRNIDGDRNVVWHSSWGFAVAAGSLVVAV